jgi:hypothetical protein
MTAGSDQYGMSTAEAMANALTAPSWPITRNSVAGDAPGSEPVDLDGWLTAIREAAK